MKTVLIGTGNIAWHIGQCLHDKGIKLHALYGRHPEKAGQLAEAWQTRACSHWDALPDDGDVYLFALSDNAYDDVIRDFPYREKIMVHTSGTLSLSLFAPLTSKRGVLYPFQSCTKGCGLQSGRLPLCIEASDKETFCTLNTLAADISNEIFSLNSAQRRQLHLAGVFANNFSNALYGIAFDLLEKQQIDTALLHPLILETALKIQQLHPRKAQTGPAVRGDANVQQKHLELLDNEKEMYREIYRLMSRFILDEKK